MVFLIGVILGTAANAQEACSATLTWTDPTLNTDGTTIPVTGPTALKETWVEYSICLAGGVDFANSIMTLESQPSQSHCVTGLEAGDWCFVAYAVNNQDNASDASNMAVKTVITAIPAVPTLLTVVDMVVYTIRQQPNRFVFLPIGTVPGGTQCDPDNYVNGKFTVPIDLVIWTSNDPNAPRPIVVVADCA